MENFYENIFKIVASVGMCDKHRNELTKKLEHYFKNNSFDPSYKYQEKKNGCKCKSNGSGSCELGCCKN